MPVFPHWQLECLMMTIVQNWVLNPILALDLTPKREVTVVAKVTTELMVAKVGVEVVVKVKVEVIKVMRKATATMVAETNIVMKEAMTLQ